ncbi:ABC transporter substrate-binding protein [Cohnella sp. CFH 77786]|uniref:stalk domain-containing protein n=1 Tax=Cohnella sp. CFH 77786 TaxID=2662265 RepID=UPI001C60DEE2|nr:stalk domain-containing protein [Cohnella sp. CFH 77786]MBW5447967.1 ABC transporter substrate-binding protein [Cohnella sp. CFH 77786]
MFKSMFRSAAIVLSFILAFGIVPLTASAAGTVKVVLDGKEISFGVAPQVINGRTMVPYRVLAEKLGAKVGWDDKTKKITVAKGTSNVVLTLKSNKATVNGQTVTLDAVPVVKNDTTLVPLRFLGESLGLWVKWSSSSNTATLASQKTITHAMGQTTLNAVPKKVVVLFNGMVDISLTLGVKPAGAVESWVQQPWYHYLRADMGGVRNLGDENQPNMEAIVALKPDLIIGSKLRHEKIYGQLSKIAPTIMTTDVFSWKTNMQMAAEALNKEDVAIAFLEKWNKRVADFKSKMGGKLKTEVSIIRFQPDGTARFYVTGYAGTILQELGLSRPKAQQVEGKTVVGVTSKEQIPLLDGDVIFDITSDLGSDEESFKSQQDWQSNPLWSNLKGVKNGKYYKVNDVTWNMSGGATSAMMMLDDLYFYFDL